MTTVTPGVSNYGGFPQALVAGASRTTIQSPFSNLVTAGFDFRKTRIEKHRLNRTIQAVATAVVVSGTVAQCADATQAVRFADRVNALVQGGKRTGRVRRLAQGAVATFGALVGGSGYTNGSYPNTPLIRTGVSANLPVGGCAADITVAGGVVTVCTLVTNRQGENYSASEILTAQAGTLGAGTGFTITIATIGVN